MSNRKKAEKQVTDFETFQKVFVESERVMRENLTKLIKARLKTETSFDARMAYKACVRLIETGTLADVKDLEKEEESEE